MQDYGDAEGEMGAALDLGNKPPVRRRSTGSSAAIKGCRCGVVDYPPGAGAGCHGSMTSMPVP
jgi:hypothetical protein